MNLFSDAEKREKKNRETEEKSNKIVNLTACGLNYLDFNRWTTFAFFFESEILLRWGAMNRR